MLAVARLARGLRRVRQRDHSAPCISTCPPRQRIRSSSALRSSTTFLPLRREVTVDPNRVPGTGGGSVRPPCSIAIAPYPPHCTCHTPPVAALCTVDNSSNF